MEKLMTFEEWKDFIHKESWRIKKQPRTFFGFEHDWKDYNAYMVAWLNERFADVDTGLQHVLEYGK